jgi:protein-disulfide isomerase
MPRNVSRLLDAGMLVCAFMLTGLVLRRELTRAGPSRPAEPVPVSNWRELAAGRLRIGPASAPVTIVEFSDFQCPYCARFAREVFAPLRRRDSRVTIVYRHWPLSIHEHAFDAAVAAECAADQSRFEQFHDALFDDQQSIGSRSWSSFAATAGVPDTVVYRKCLASDAARKRVEVDRQFALGLGARGTPTFIVNGLMLSGALDSARIDALVKASRR